MKPESTKLIEPTLELESEFLAMVEEFKAEGCNIINGIGSIDINNFTDSVHQAKNHAQGIALPEGWVPASTYWLVCDNRIIGTCNLRHQLNEFLKKFGGHIGYSVRPSQRGKGYGTQMLRLALKKARQLSIPRVLVTCNKNNIASAKVIRKNGGILDSENHSPRTGQVTQRYWIDL